MHVARRTRWGLVRIGKTQLFESVRMARVIRGGSLRTRTEAQADGRVSKSGDDLRKGCSGGMEGGAGGGTPFPITRPPSPVRRTHLQTRKIDFRQARREPAGHDSRPGETLPQSQLTASAAFALRSPLKGQSPLPAAPVRGMESARWHSTPLREQAGSDSARLKALAAFRQTKSPRRHSTSGALHQLFQRLT